MADWRRTIRNIWLGLLSMFEAKTLSTILKRMEKNKRRKNSNSKYRTSLISYDYFSIKLLLWIRVFVAYQLFLPRVNLWLLVDLEFSDHKSSDGKYENKNHRILDNECFRWFTSSAINGDSSISKSSELFCNETNDDSIIIFLIGTYGKNHSRF